MKSLILILLAALLFIAPPASAQTQNCWPYDAYIQHLFNNFDEVPVSRGIVSNGSVMVVLASEEGSWTLLVVSLNNTACIVTVGEAWERLTIPTFPQELELNKDEISA